MFSKACEYGIKATLYIARQSQLEKRASLKEIAGAINSPEAFTAKNLHQLARYGIINSGNSPNGGFYIPTVDQEKGKLSHIVTAIDGSSIYNGCGLGLRECNELQPCPVHDKFKIIRDQLKAMLETTTIHELTTGLKEGLTFLKR